MNKYDIAYKIIDFWHMIEFLSQDKFPEDTRGNNRIVSLVQKSCLNEIISDNDKRKLKSIKKIAIFNNINKNKSLEEILNEDNEKYKTYPELSSKIHILMGKIKKEALTKKIYEAMNIEDKRPEEEKDRIPVIGLKIDKDGCYVEGSLKISPLLWAVTKIVKAKGKTDKTITISQYILEIEEIEKTIDKIESLNEKSLSKLYGLVVDKYINHIFDKNLDVLEEVKELIYIRYADEKTLNKEDESSTDISDFMNSFYINDLEMLKEAIESKNIKSEMADNIIDYIVKTYYEEKGIDSNNDKVDIRYELDEIGKWLFVENYPMGKWPGKFNPALMQQIAINIGISNDDRMKKIFSVNGPPGTGKTTLLKDVIASNIVERAKIMLNYEKADDAFEKAYFEDGKCRNNSYDKYYSEYYTFKDKKLSEYGVLVASCNNSAVENITVELPAADNLLKGVGCERKELEEISNLFDVTKSKNSESYKKFDDKGNLIFVEKPDIYFSHLADKLAGINNGGNITENSQWGIISAPMGKSKNIKNYHYAVLQEVINSFYYKKQVIEERGQKFIEAKENFSKQLEVVKRLENNLNEVSKLSYRYNERKKNKLKTIEEDVENIGKVQNKILQIQNEFESTKEQLKKSEMMETELKKASDESKKLLNDKELDLADIDNKLEVLKNNIIEKEDSCKLTEILLKSFRKTERLRQIEELKKDRVGLENTKSERLKELNNCKHKFNEDEAAARKAEKCVDEIKEKLANYDVNKNEAANKILDFQMAITNAKNLINRDKKELQDKLESLKSKMAVIDDDFAEIIKDKDHSEYTKIQVSDPWVTDEYNRAREKLFYLALQLNKEFVLSSKACNYNFRNLSMMWGLMKNNDKEIPCFSKRDKLNSFKHLLNSLFLLTPVISTTFASVGRFLSNIEEQDSLGLLIVDEAGQASPQVALGALWRCNRAIIVGDPNQVEPVVTDELDVIKNAILDEYTEPYISKSISVQQFADKVNKYGSYITCDDEKKWVGCPLIVHRRCIEPMFSISNALSYDGTMKMQTIAPKDSSKFIYSESKWINVCGKEKGNKNHFVDTQGMEALKIIIEGFKKTNGEIPDIFIISPFTSVINGMKELVLKSEELKQYGRKRDKWLEENLGTVHKFQGKEAGEVIFLLGCDDKASGAVKWVNRNIINVAATRAKYRLYIIGDYNVWKNNELFQITKKIVDAQLKMV